MAPMKVARIRNGKGMPKKNLSGFSLIEIMITIAILAIFAKLASPAMSAMIATQRIRSISSDLAADFALARMEAIKRSNRVGLIRSGTSWNDGWNMFQDANANGQCDTGETCNIQVHQKISSSISITPCDDGVADSTINAITFSGDGRIRAYASGVEQTLTSSFRFLITAPQISDAVKRRIELSPSGRLTTLKNVTDCNS